MISSTVFAPARGMSGSTEFTAAAMLRSRAFGSPSVFTAIDARGRGFSERHDDFRILWPQSCTADSVRDADDLIFT
jgi:hypothetical protein